MSKKTKAKIQAEIKTECPNCQRGQMVPLTSKGKRCRCYHCNEIFVIFGK